VKPASSQEIRDRLLAMRAAIESLEESRRSSSEVVELDQTRTGRLSRIDALQLQAMAKAGQARSQQQLQRIEAALQRLERGTYGECLDCGEPIAPARLEANPTVSLCVSCASARESREGL
jgi:DnaK suppressor protein